MEIVTVSVNGVGKAYPRGTSLFDISRDYVKDYAADINLAVQDGSLRELSKKVYENCKVEFLTVSDSDGYRTYRRGMILVFMKALYKVLGSSGLEKVRIEHTIGSGIYGELEGDVSISAELLSSVKEEMK